MNALLIAPFDRPAVTHLAELAPLAIVPILGKPLAAYWVEYLLARGASQVRLLAVDRPDQVRRSLGDGSRWGLKLEVLPTLRELTPDQAREKYRPEGGSDWLAAPADAALIDRLPDLPEYPLFENYAGWYSALSAWIGRAATPDRIGYRQIQPGVWVGLHTRLPPDARVHAPCWIGEHVRVGSGSIIGPGAIIENRVLIGRDARIVESVVGPDTLVGDLTLVGKSLARHAVLVNWETGSRLRVPDAFLLSPLPARPLRSNSPGRAGRLLALIVLAGTAPAAAGLCLFRNRREPLWRMRQGVRPLATARSPVGPTFAYAELPGLRGWWRRWPQLWSIARGDMAWIGNRPLDAREAAGLGNDFERSGLTAPVGLISLSDAEGRPGRSIEEDQAHASFYAARSDWRLNLRIFLRAVRRTRLAPARPPEPRAEESIPFRSRILKSGG